MSFLVQFPDTGGSGWSSYAYCGPACYKQDLYIYQPTRLGRWTTPKSRYHKMRWCMWCGKEGK